ncbi:MAG: selenide, water dikinase SelD [Bdellovibrionota bacterium]
MKIEPILLTQTVQKGGCAAKVAAKELRQILAQVNFPPKSQDVIIDGHLMDDAAIIKVSESLALVQTLDFFTPIVDTPYVFGQIAAANALSDVYAMGGVPKTALAILAFPLSSMDKSVIVEVLQGASDKIAESGSSLVGGHSIDDDTLKFGLSVTGYVHPQKVWQNSGAHVGDLLILTKALGTGTATSALKRQDIKESDIADEIKSMCELNNIGELLSDDLMLGIRAATDITGFGLAGHCVQMARASNKKLQINFKNLPTFARTFNFLEKGYLTKAHRTNKEYVSEELDAADLTDLQQNILFDPQTSGGLLLSVRKELASKVVDVLIKKNKNVCIVGEVLDFVKQKNTRLMINT